MGTAENWHNEYQDDYANREKSASDFAQFKKTKAYAQCLQTGREKAAANLDGVWRAVGIEGVVYPFPDTPKNNKAKLAYDDYIGACLAINALKGDATAIGKIILEQLESYLNEKAEEFVNENWKAWQ